MPFASLIIMVIISFLSKGLIWTGPGPGPLDAPSFIVYSIIDKCELNMNRM